jgi:hypothetical protein
VRFEKNDYICLAMTFCWQLVILGLHLKSKVLSIKKKKKKKKKRAKY